MSASGLLPMALPDLISTGASARGGDGPTDSADVVEQNAASAAGANVVLRREGQARKTWSFFLQGPARTIQ